MFDVILYEPEIPPNTGNVMRLCANAGLRLHLIEPLGFRLEDRRLRRAGLDYREWAQVRVHPDWVTGLAAISPRRLFALTTRGLTAYTQPRFEPGDAFLFGPETRGLPTSLLETIRPTYRLRIPMQPESRSLNLANAVAIVLFEAWRQQDFAGAVLGTAAKGP
ncbi:tRNA (uridine(34)/cytosine(34)/5-carboxymethylaminomethyluridine(34)-2'-O)-methyltransferase TrmL [Thiocapsa imhoffii]|uniref:tRNA (cytidine(34)-2'-O)-methyltransferase n=1 Tax=Thiocapsa imhoffii TaxID=382777 RepID=A0A9X0WI43_9GAMM|nr:tRNA (cytidine(34)-2'-O)-methyltransferase [Thiocapsa imhoffii]MBK1645008.1 tRNA (uridine(34)/cytosine(34)/5-carboxymethylaminomethyluridine(34)-2'-O)-methyltransferase TrmL [Thiocapsa imhoffii]